MMLVCAYSFSMIRYCKCPPDSPYCSCGPWCLTVWNWANYVSREIRDFFRDYTGTLPKRSFQKSATDYYDWLVKVLRLAAHELDSYEIRRGSYTLYPNLKRSRRLLLFDFFEYYESNKNSCGHDIKAIITMMVEYCKKKHPHEKDVVASELLRRAIARKHCEISRVLLGMVEQIDRPFVENTQTNVDRPLSVAVKSGNLEILYMILERGALIDVPPLRWERPVLLIAAQKKSVEITQLLLKFGANPHVKDQGGRGVLHWLVRGGNPCVAKIFIDLGVKASDKDYNGTSALEEAVIYNDPNMVRFFLDYCDDLSEQDLNDALRASMISEMELRLPIIRMLLLRGADPDGGPLPYRSAGTPIQQAVYDDLYAVTNELILAGADVDGLLRSRPYLNTYIRRLVVKNVVERLEAQEPVSPLYETALQIHDDSLFENCQDERRRMSQTTIIKGVKYSDVMESDEGSFTYAMRQYGNDFVEAFERDVKYLFPIHQEDLRRKFEIMRNKWEGKWQVEEVVSQMMWDGMLPLTVVSKIAKHLHPNDLKAVEPDMTEVDDLADLTYPRGRLSKFQRRYGVRCWRKRRSYNISNDDTL